MRKPETGSQKYGTSIVKTDEYLLLAETMVENGSSIAGAVEDISFIDDCMSMQRMVNTIGKTKSVCYTKAGNRRKNLHLRDFINARLEQMVKG